MGNLVEHAKRELLKLGYKPIDECKDEPEKWMQENILELLDVFSKQGHSGSSASYVINYFTKLANFNTISPIMCTDDEWNDVGTDDGKILYQNSRCSAVFKISMFGKPYYLDAIVFVDKKHTSYTGSAFNNKNERIKSSQTIKLPFTPKTFYVDVIDIGDDKHHIKDESQLKEVWKYYEHQETKSYARLKKLRILDENTIK